MNDTGEFGLERFWDAQNGNYDMAFQEIKRGQKRSHWMWYIFPQVRGLGHSGMAQKFAIRSKREALAYLNHPILGSRLRECAAALLAHTGRSITDILGYPDDLKLMSSMTLFSSISSPDNVFAKVLGQFYSGRQCEFTIEYLKNNP